MSKFGKALLICAALVTLLALPAGIGSAQPGGPTPQALTPRAYLPMVVGGSSVPGNISGVVRNAADAQPIANATVTVVGLGLSTTTNAAGQYTIPNVGAGARTVRAEAANYNAQQRSVTVISGQTVTADFDLQRGAPVGTFTITLAWQSAVDLDLHLWTPWPEFWDHIYWENPGDCTEPDDPNQLWDPYACLTADQQTRQETITVVRREEGTYNVGVHSWQQNNVLAGSGATVTVADSIGVVWRGAVPSSGSGYWWHVFDMDGGTGQITTGSGLLDGEVLAWLDWSTMDDLDAHLWTPFDGGARHLAWDNVGRCVGSLPYACLLGDVWENGTTMVPRERVIISQPQAGSYTFAVTTYGGFDPLTATGARVRLFDGTGQIGQWDVPTSGDGIWWHVFDYDGGTGVVTTVNQLLSDPPQLP